MDLYFSAIIQAGLALDEPSLFAARDQGYDAVRRSLQPLSQLTYFGKIASGKSLYMKEHQILKRRDAVGADRVLGKALKPSQLITEFRQLFKIRLG